jgi:hypothetical protein
MHRRRFGSKIVDHVSIIFSKTLSGIKRLAVVSETDSIGAIDDIEVLWTDPAYDAAVSNFDTIWLRRQ